MMPLAVCTLVLFAAPATSPDPRSLTVPTAEIERARGLVQLLASDLFKDRDRASRELERMGRLALPALETARTNDDPEVRLRTRSLLPRAEADDLRARVDTFLADTDAKFDHDLHGWQRFRAIAGDGKSSRDLFALILKNPANFDLLLALKGVPSDVAPALAAVSGGVTAAAQDSPRTPDLAQAIVARRQRLQTQFTTVIVNGVYRPPGTPDIQDMALLILAESFVSERYVAIGNSQYYITNFFYQPTAREALAGKGAYGEPFRNLTLHWMDTRDGVVGLTNAMGIAQNMNLGPQKVSAIAAKMLRTVGNANQMFNRANAITTIARHGAKEYLFEIAALFTDATPVVRAFPNNPQIEIQLRDIALAMALNLTGQDPKNYGYEALNTTPGMQFSYSNFRFRTDDKQTADQKRAAAFAKWREYETTLHASLAGPAGSALVLTKFAEKADVVKGPK